MDYTIKRGDTLSQLAEKNNTTVKNLQAANPDIKNPDLIYTGRTLSIPSTATTPTNTSTTPPTPTGTAIYAGGAATPSGPNDKPIAYRDKYGKDTPVASTPSPYVARGTLDTSNYNFGTNNASDIPTPESVLQQKKDEAQALVNQLRTQFAGELSAMEKTGAENAAIVRARNIKGGLGGSDFADTSAIRDRTKTEEAIAARKAEQEAKINAILAGVPSAADAAYATKLENYKTQKGFQTGLLDEKKTKVKSILSSLASAGHSLEDLKTESPDKYNSLLVNGNYTPLELDTAYTESLPENLRTKYTETVIQGQDGKAQLLKYGLDPIKGSVVSHTYDLGVDYNSLKGVKPITTKDGKLLIPSGDGTYKEVYSPEPKAATTKTAKPFVSGKLSISGDQMAQYSDTLEKSKTLYGGDGKYVNPDVYRQAYDAWVTGGGIAKDFLAKFPPNAYVNPENKDLPQYLRSTKKGGTKTTERKLPGVKQIGK